MASNRGGVSAVPVSNRARLRRAREELYRGIILDAAESIFAEHGFGAAKMQDVATVAKVSTSTVYGLFEGKEALFDAVHARRGLELLAAIRDQPSALSEPLDRLLGGVAAYAGYLMEHPDYLRMLSHVNAWADLRLLESQGQVDTSQRGMTLVSRAFARGIAEGVFVAEDPELMTRLMHAAHQVRLLDWLAQGMRVPPAEVVRRLQRELVCMFCPPDRIVALLTARALLDP